MASRLNHIAIPTKFFYCEDCCPDHPCLLLNLLISCATTFLGLLISLSFDANPQYRSSLSCQKRHILWDGAIMQTPFLGHGYGREGSCAFFNSECAGNEMFECDDQVWCKNTSAVWNEAVRLTISKDLCLFPHHKALESILQSFFVLPCKHEQRLSSGQCCWANMTSNSNTSELSYGTSLG
jgi:hypothetical protein